MREMLRREEIAAVLSDLAAGGAPAIVLKGTALAYSVYDAPIARPRLDTDLLIDSAHQDVARGVLVRRAATPPLRTAISSFRNFRWRRPTRSASARHRRALEDQHPAGLRRCADVRRDAASRRGDSRAGTRGLSALRGRRAVACVRPPGHASPECRAGSCGLDDSHLLASRLTPRNSPASRALRVIKDCSGVRARALRLAQTLFGTGFRRRDGRAVGRRRRTLGRVSGVS